MNPSPRKKTYSALAWALFSQSIWLPALVVDTQDRLASMADKYSLAQKNKSQASPGDLLASSGTMHSEEFGLSIAKTRSNTQTSGILLNAFAPRSNNKLLREPLVTPNSLSQSPRSVFSAPPAPKSIGLALQLSPRQIPITYSLTPPPFHHEANKDPLRAIYTKSDLLGGSLSLQDLNEPEMPPVARAERLQWIRSGDPLAPIPNQWREAMRKALSSLSKPEQSVHSGNAKNLKKDLGINSARVIHVPSSRIRRSADVPLALQADGTVDILNSPDDPAVVEEIKTWSSKQEAPAKGSMTPAIVHLHPLPTLNSPPKVNGVATIIPKVQAPPVSVAASESGPSVAPPSYEPTPSIPASVSATVPPPAMNQAVSTDHSPPLTDMATPSSASEVKP